MKSSHVKVVALTLLITIVAVCYASLLASACRSPYNQALTTRFITCPPSKVTLSQPIHVSVLWSNPSGRDYKGCVLFLVEAKKVGVNPVDVSLSYGGTMITPNKSDDSLCFNLPLQTYKAHSSGIILVEVTYYKVDSYRWQIGIVSR